MEEEITFVMAERVAGSKREKEVGSNDGGIVYY